MELVSLPAAQRFDRALAQSQSRLEVGASGAAGRQREHAGAARLLLSKRVGRFFGHARRTSSEVSPFTASSALNYSLYTPQVSVSFVPDVFGLNRRTIESLKAQEAAGAICFGRDAYHVEFQCRRRRPFKRRRCEDRLTRPMNSSPSARRCWRFCATNAPRAMPADLDVAAQEAQLAQTVATLPPLLKQLAQQRDLLAVLSGGFPSQELPEEFELSSLQLPRGTAPDASFATRRTAARCAPGRGEPAFGQRPDRRGAREPAAKFEPYGRCRQHGRYLQPYVRVKEAFGTWAAGLTQPVFDGGTLKHRELAARAAYTQADEQYHSTVLTAFQNVADTLHAITQDADGSKGRGCRKGRRRRNAQPHAKAIGQRLRQLPRALECGTSLSASRDQPGAGSIESLSRTLPRCFKL